MACANEVNKENSSRLLDKINTLNVFGKCQQEDLVFIKNEKKDREDKFKKAQIDKKKERKRQERLRNEQYIADREFSDEEFSKKIMKNGTVNYNSPKKSCGRGVLSKGPVKKSEGVEMMVPGHERSRPTPEEKDWFLLPERTERVTRTICQCLGESEARKQYMVHMLDLNRKDSRIEDISVRHTPDSSSNTDQFEDANDTSQSSSPQSFCSVPSPASNSPVLPSSRQQPASTSIDSPLQAQPCPTPLESSTGNAQRKPRKSRLAARFSNLDHNPDIEKEQIPEIKEQQDPLAVLGTSQTSLAPSVLCIGSRSTGNLFIRLHPSQRMLSNDVLQSKDLFYKDYAKNASTSKNYTYNAKDFPPL